MAVQEKVREPVITKEGISKAYHLMEYYLRLAVFTNAVPFTYDRKVRRYHFDDKGLKYRIWFVAMFLALIVETSQVLYELWRGDRDVTVSRGEWCLVLFITISWTLILSCHFYTFRYGHLMVNHFNQLLRMREYFTEKELPYSPDHNFVRGHLVAAFLQCFFQCILVATEGIMGKKQYLYSNVPESYRNVGTGLVWVAYAYYRVITNFMTGYFFSFSGIFHVMTCNQILEYRMKTQKNFTENLKTYRMLQLLCSRYNETYSSTWIPSLTAFCSASIILANFGTLRFADTMTWDKYMNFPLMAIMACIMTFTLYPRMASVKETCEGEKLRMLSVGVKLNQVMFEGHAQSKGDQDQGYKNGVKNLNLKQVDVSHGNVQMGKATTNMSQIGLNKAFAGKVNGPKRIIKIELQDFEFATIRMDEEPSKLDTSKHETNGTSMHALTETEDHLTEVTRLKLVKLYARSCPLIAVQMGSFYGIKKSTVLNIFDFIICNTISTLLTT